MSVLPGTVIDETTLHRPRVSRETRQLLATVLLAVVALWVLGRVRYPERPATPNPVPALLTQLGPRVTLDELAAESAGLRARLGAALLPVPTPAGTAAAIRVSDDTALALLPDRYGREANEWSGSLRTLQDEDGPASSGPRVMASDPATGLAILRVDSEAAGPPAAWEARELGRPRYLLATVVAAGHVALRPAFVAALQPVATPAWSSPIWAVPATPELMPGSLVFTADAELAGLVVPHGEGLAIVPAATLLADARRIRELPPRMPGSLGIEVQPLTPALAAATGARTGVVVAWVDPQGPAAGQVAAGDAIEAVDGHWLESHEHWAVRTARLVAGEPIVLGARRRGEWRDVQLTALPQPGRPLGLTLRRVTNVGSEVLDVDRRSAAHTAGIEPGDVITLAGAHSAPTPAQVREAFEAAVRQPVLLALSRGTSSRIVTLHR